ncbi:MAG: hypothetical protein ABH858_00460 [Candidatus Omnitrophota bacterium]
MSNTGNFNSLSSHDEKRLKKAFFSQPPLPTVKKGRKKRLIINSFLTVLAILILMPLIKSRTVLFTSSDITNTEEAGLEKEKVMSAADLTQDKSETAQKKISIELPLEEANKFIVNLDDKIDISNSTIVFVVKNPREDFSVSIIFRDTNFFSNASSPIIQQVSCLTDESDYLKIPVQIKDNIDTHLSPFRINQMRFAFIKGGKETTLPLLVKNVFLERRR